MEINLKDFECLIAKIKNDKFVEEHKCGNSVVTISRVNRQGNPDTVFIFKQDEIIYTELEMNNLTLITTKHCSQFEQILKIVNKKYPKVNKTILCNGCKYNKYCTDNEPKCNPYGYCSILDME